MQVPDGYRMEVTSHPQGGIRRTLHPLLNRRPTWEWAYTRGPRGDITASIKEQPNLTVFQPTVTQEAEPFSYVI